MRNRYIGHSAGLDRRATEAHGEGKVSMETTTRILLACAATLAWGTANPSFADDDSSRVEARQGAREGKEEAREGARDGRQEARGDGPRDRREAKEDARDGRKGAREEGREDRQDAR